MPSGQSALPPVRSSNVPHFLDGVARHGVEEESDEDDEEREEQQLNDDPLVVVPQNVPQRLERVHKPHEARVWPAGDRGGTGFSYRDHGR